MLGALAVYGMTLAPEAAGLTVLKLDGTTSGSMVHALDANVRVSAESNYDDSWDAVLAYDFNGHPELSYGGQQFDGSWDGGNIADFNGLGDGLVIAGRVPAKILEARKNPGTMYFHFDEPATRFGLVVVDIDGDELDPSSGYFLRFSYQGEVVDTLDYADFTTPGSGFYDASIAFGDNTANRFRAISADALGDGSFARFDEVAFTPGGSQVVAEVSYAVPTPTALAAGLSLLGLSAMRRKRDA
ncbi:MAG: PTPA-CTERM sorting domain-containing protein [Planctomycetota bacterium]